MRKALTNAAVATVTVVAISMFAAGGGQAAAPSQVDPCVSTTVEVTTTVAVPTVTPTPTVTPIPTPTPTPSPTPIPGPARVVHAPSGVDPCVTPTTDVGSGGGQIPATGNDSSPLATAGLIAMVVGVVLLGVTVVRRTKPSGA